MILVVAGSSPVDHPILPKDPPRAPSHPPDMHPLEDVIGHTFHDPTLLAEALTHASLAYESQRPQNHNQRLEFLGDAVLQLTLSEALFRRLPKADEGVLTKARARLVSAKALARLAKEIDLGTHLHMGRGEEINGGRERESSLADALEAVAGAVFLDAGLDAARGVVNQIFARELEAIIEAPQESNPKGQLQELIQAVASTPPEYQIISQGGPDHSKVFEATVSWQGVVLGTGSGKSKKDAQAAAAIAALENPLFQDMLSPHP